MESSQLVHDELLLKLDEPRERSMAQTIKSATHPGKILSAPVSESTALISSTKEDALMIDMAEVEAILNAEERDAVLTDAKLQTMDILREESIALFGIAAPMFLFVALEIAPGVLMNMMLGFTDKERSAQILAGFNLESVFEMLLISGMTGGFVAGVDTLCTQAFGGRRFVEMWLFAQAGLLAYVITLPFVLLVLLSGSSILQALGQDPAIAGIAGNVLAVVAVGYPFGVVLSLMRSVLHAQNVVMPFVVTSLIAWVGALAIAYSLAFHTSYGYMGFAIATPLSWLLKVLMLTPVLLRNEVFVQSWPGWQFNRALRLLPKVAKLGGAGLLMVTFQMMGISILALISGLLPNADIAIAANGILGSLFSLCFLPFTALSTAGAVRMGNSLGAGQARRARIVGQIVTAVCFVVSTLLSLVVVPLCANGFAQLSTPSQATASAAAELINQVLPIIPLFSLSFALQAIFRACGRQLLSAVINFVCCFVIGVPLGTLFGFKWGLDLAWLWYGSEVGLVLTIASGFAWLAHTSWTQLAHEAKHNVKLQDPATEDAC